MGAPVFLLASERSGTNLLRRRLTERQGRVFGPSPLHLLKHLYFAEPYYGDLQDDRCFTNFIEDALGLAYHHFSPWDVKYRPAEVLDAYPKISGKVRSSVGLMHVLYTMYSHSKGYDSYFCKDNNLFDFVSDIRLVIPNARFVYLHRDPRDVVLSQRQRPLQNRGIAYLAQLWRDEQIKCIRHASTLFTEGGLIRVSYEDLIAREDEVMTNLCRSLDIVESEGCEAVFNTEKTDIHEWANLEQPTISNNSGKFMKGLSRSTIRKIEAICWYQMRWLGYSPLNEERPTISSGRVRLEIGLAKITKVLRSRLNNRLMTEGQEDQIHYVESLQKKWQ